jgi:hypothetical protein
VRSIDWLQWLGFLCCLAGYWFFGTRFRLACALSMLGCAACFLWALLIEPIAWGIVALESTVFLINIKNIWTSWRRDRKNSRT